MGTRHNVKRPRAESRTYAPRQREVVVGREGDRLASSTTVVEEGGIEAGGSRREKREGEREKERERRDRVHTRG